MRQNNLADVEEKLRSRRADLPAEAYSARLHMLYGALERVDLLTPEVMTEILWIEETRLAEGADPAIGNPPREEDFLREYSRIAFCMARESLRDGRTFLAAMPLQSVYGVMISGIGEELRRAYRREISETGLDLGYAAGNHEVASLRMAPLIRTAKK